MTPPTHIVAEAGDRYSLCGVKNPLPVVVARFVEAHVKGWGMVVCHECAGEPAPQAPQQSLFGDAA